MTSRPDRAVRAWLLAGLCAGLVACADMADEPSPAEGAQAALARGDGRAAERHLRDMLAQGSQPAELAALLGQAALQQGDLPKARRWLGEGNFSEETAALGFRLLGRLELREGRLGEAAAAFNRALDINSESAALWADIGRLRFRGGEQIEAIEAAERAIAIDPKDPAALHFRGQLVRDSHGPIPALEWYAAAAENGAGDREILTDYAATLGEIGEAHAALDVLDEVAARWPAAPRVSFLRAVLAARGGDTQTARGLLQRAPQAERDSPAGLMLGGIIDLEQGHYASAAQTFDRLAGLQPDNRHVSHLLALALSLSGGERELVARFAEAANARYATPYLRMSVGRALEALDRREEAAIYLDAAARPAGLTISPLPSRTPSEAIRVSKLESGLALRDFVREMLRPGETDEAVAEAQEFAERFPGSGDAARLLGDAQLANGDLDKAIASYARAARVRQDWPLTNRLMAAYLAKGDEAAMVEVLEFHLAGGTRNPSSSAFAGAILAERQQFARAAAMLDSAIAHGSGRDPGVLVLRSEMALRLGAREEAADFALRAHRLQPMYPPAIQARLRTLEDGEARARLERKLRSISSR